MITLPSGRKLYLIAAVPLFDVLRVRCGYTLWALTFWLN
jgi:hypothetical protein